jgi:carbon starvation protein
MAQEGGWQKFWTLFGASNQLLAALTLLAITVWLYQARKRVWFTLLPMTFVLTLTVWSLAGIALSSLRRSGGLDVDLINAVAALALVLLALFLAVSGLVKLRGERRGSLVPEAA